MKRLDTTPTLYRPEDVDEIIAEVQRDEDEWTFVADHDPKGTGYSRIAILDETSTLIGYL